MGQVFEATEGSLDAPEMADCRHTECFLLAGDNPLVMLYDVIAAASRAAHLWPTLAAWLDCIQPSGYFGSRSRRLASICWTHEWSPVIAADWNVSVIMPVQLARTVLCEAKVACIRTER